MTSKICKFIKIWIAGIVIGETIASYYKDEKFRNKLNEAKWFDKCKVIFNNLIDVNKSFFETVKTTDYNALAGKYKSIFQEKVNMVWEKLEVLKQEVEKLNDEKLKPVLEDLTEKYNEIKEILENKKTKLINKHEHKLRKIEEKINEIKDKINEKLWKF